MSCHACLVRWLVAALRLSLSLTGARLPPPDAPPTGALAPPPPERVAPPTGGFIARCARVGRNRVLVFVGLALISVILAVTARASAALVQDRGAWDGADPLLRVLAGYCAAETQAAATLEPHALEPYLASDGPWRRRRLAALAARARAGRPHTARLLSWQVRQVRMDRAGAAVATLELWENREAGMAAPATSLVRVVYELRREDGSWRIWDVHIEGMP